MPIRDILISLSIFSTVPFCLFRPWIGVLVWTWIAYMNPHRLGWSFAYDLPVAQMVAIPTLIGFIFTGDRKPFIWSRETLLMLALWAWFTVTCFTALYPDAAWEKWNTISKSFLMTLLAVPLFQDRARFRLLLLVMAASIGFYGLKGGLFVLANGGQFMVLGPPASFFESNNELGLVLNMSLPLLLFLAREEPRKWFRRVLWASFLLTMLAVPFTYSRGAVLGLAAVLAMLFLRANRRLLVICLALVGIVVFSYFAPMQWFQRMETLESYQADESAQLRLMSWRVAYEIAQDYPIFGGGFKVFTHRATYDVYMPEYPRRFGHDAHSIYFNLLGEHGWVGLGLFLLVVASIFATLRRLRNMGKRHEELAWVGNYAHMFQASIVTYLITGAFLSAAYFDLAYQLFIGVVLLKHLATQQEAALTQSPVPLPALPPKAGVPARAR
jgi:probable O-glycosylation ligase (exosortase A-associated)